MGPSDPTMHATILFLFNLFSFTLIFIYLFILSMSVILCFSIHLSTYLRTYLCSNLVRLCLPDHHRVERQNINVKIEAISTA